MLSGRPAACNWGCRTMVSAISPGPRDGPLLAASVVSNRLLFALMCSARPCPFRRAAAPTRALTPNDAIERLRAGHAGAAARCAAVAGAAQRAARECVVHTAILRIVVRLVYVGPSCVASSCAGGVRVLATSAPPEGSAASRMGVVVYSTYKEVRPDRNDRYSACFPLRAAQPSSLRSTCESAPVQPWMRRNQRRARRTHDARARGAHDTVHAEAIPLWQSSAPQTGVWGESESRRVLRRGPQQR